MKRIIGLVTVCMSLLSCQKSDSADISENWLKEKQAEYASCICLTEIRSAKFRDTLVYEVRLISPVCDGLNQVYRQNGTLWFHSGDQVLYNEYLSQAKDIRSLWRCDNAKK